MHPVGAHEAVWLRTKRVYAATIAKEPLEIVNVAASDDVLRSICAMDSMARPSPPDGDTAVRQVAQLETVKRGTLRMRDL